MIILYTNNFYLLLQYSIWFQCQLIFFFSSSSFSEMPMDRILSAEIAVDIIYEERLRHQSGTNGHSSSGGNTVSSFYI